MKSDIDQIMQSRQVDAILVTGPAQHNPPMVYLTGGGHLTNADLIKRRGSDPVLHYFPMERDEAAKTGLPTRNLADFRLVELLKQANGDQLKATIKRYQKMLEELGFTSGRLAVYGQSDAGLAYALFTGLERALPGLTIVSEYGDTILKRAMATKDADEVERIRRMGRVTVEVVANTANFLTSHKTKDGVLVKADGQPLTIGDVKSQIRLWLAKRDAESPEGVIFAIGRDAGIPHSSGNPDDLLRLGQTIVYDIFPCESGGGYYYDFTRTWCLGYASDEAQSVYEDVLSVFRQVKSELKANTLCHDYQMRACELFEAQGHPTIKSNPQTEAGYVHSLGHGVGLHIHENPRFAMVAAETDRLDPGVVVSFEPGLYYPERGLGVRLEDTLWVNPGGEIETLVDYPLDLVLPMRQSG
jgi:Xaa-Pro aminopeptidase